ncbi:MAG: hypothetical protein LBQ24_05160 [Candidatus Peribacteria bacterium]|jgi:hypothetical protein|nr:hypothetical protein [Candidatus Peribacteria bacterium]
MYQTGIFTEANKSTIFPLKVLLSFHTETSLSLSLQEIHFSFKSSVKLTKSEEIKILFPE